MNHPDNDALAALALGEPASPGAAEHARGCSVCSDAVAALRETLSTLRAPVPELVAPPASVWDAVQRQIDAAPVAAGLTETPVTPAAVWGADITGPEDPAGRHDGPTHDSPATDELARARTARGGRSRYSLGWVAGAAAAGLVIGGALAWVLDRDTSAPTSVTVASTSLDTLDTQQTKGSADVVRNDSRLDLDVSTEPIDPEGGYLEVWLINKDLQRMVSVGVLRPDGADQSFPLPQSLLDQGYVIVDISREGFDDAPAHSGDSVVRGTLQT